MVEGMKKGGNTKRPIIIALIAAVLLLVIVLLTNRGSVAKWTENGIATVLTPIEGVAAKASNAIVGFFKNLFNTTDADKENERLRGELALQQQLKTENEELRRENEKLAALLGYAGSLGEYELKTGNVIAKSTGIWFRTLTLDIGRNDGVDVDMTVISGSGLVGRVTEVGYDWCKVTCIIDSSSTVPVLVERTRDNCMAKGLLESGSGEAMLELYYMPSDRTNLAPGDVVITSGIGGIYPKGIMVGTVTEVLTEDDISAIIAPATDFEHLEFVTVILGEKADKE